MKLELHPKQLEVINAITLHHVGEVFFGGAAGGGKSFLLRALAIIWCMQVPGIQVYIFRRLYKDLLRSHMQGPGSFPVLLQEFIGDKLVKINHSSNEINFKNTSKIILSHIQYESDLDNYLSQEINIALFDEASTFTEKMFRFIRSRVRLGGLEVPGQFKGCLPFIGLASNPRGPMHSYLKRAFVDAAPYGVVFVAPEIDGGSRRIFIPSRIVDNPTLTRNDPDYVKRLKGLGDPEVIKAYLDGDWSAVEGAALPMWDPNVHIIDAFEIPRAWSVKRCYDYGYSAPYSVLWLATSNGEEYLTEEGHRRCVPKGSIFVILEEYGDDGRENGLKENVRTTARKVIKKEIDYFGFQRVVPGPADNSIFDKEQGPSISEMMSEEGVSFIESNKKPGSRIHGLAVVRQMLEEALATIPERACLYVFSRCVRLIEHMPILQLDSKTGEDVDTDGIDHDWDTLRYGVLDAIGEVQIIKVRGA